MNSHIIETIKDALEDITHLSPEKLQDLIRETVAAFQTIHTKVTSKDEAEREEGVKSAIELKAVMEEQIQKLQEKLGMSPEQIGEYITNPANFSTEQFNSMTESKLDLEHLKQGLQPEKKDPSAKRRKRNQHFLVG